jgi:hypothetical protein
MLRISLLLLGLAVLSNLSVAQEHYYCRAEEMPVSWKTNVQPVKIVHSSAVFLELGTAVPALDVRNTQTAAITNLDLVIEYLDQKGRVVDTATVGGAAAGFENAMPAPFSVENTETWKGPLDPGEIARVQGMSDGNRTVTCPVSGQITFVMARFRNGAVQQHGLLGWQVPPLPRIVPQLDSACPVLHSSILEIPAKLKISDAGDVLGVSPSSGGDDPGVLAWAIDQMKRWKFHPALVDGQPRNSELSVDFVFQVSPEPNLAAISPTAPSVLIQFFPSGRESQPRCIEAFAQLTENSTIP